MPAASGRLVFDKKRKVERTQLTLSRLKTLMVDRGYHEVINYSFISPKFNNCFSTQPSVSVKNPISEDMAVMRQSLLPGLLLNYKFNFNHQQSRIRLFEQGKCFFSTEDKKNRYQETEYFSAIAGGDLLPISSRKSIPVDFYAVKADLEALLNCCYQEGFNFKVCDKLSWLHPGQSAYIYQGSQRIGIIGVLHPKTMELFQIKPDPPVVFEVYCDKIINRPPTRYQKTSVLPLVTRDLNLIVEKGLPVQILIDAIKKSKANFLKEINVFDVYQSEILSKNKKSVAIRLIFQNELQTMDDNEISEEIKKILKKTFQLIGAVLRD